MTARPDGIYPNSIGYEPDPTRLSPNGAKKLLPPSTPKKFDEYRKHPEKHKRAWDFGRVAHKLVLGEGDQFLILDPEIHGLKKDGGLADKPTSTTNWKDAEANARAEGLTPIHVDDYGKALEMARVVHQHKTAGPLLAEGDAEEWLLWTDAETGQGMRQRLDWKTRRDGRLTIVEYKTDADASPEAFSRKVFKLGYYLACAFAITGAKALGLDVDPEVLIIAQDKESPYDVSIHYLDDEAIRYSCQRMREAITVYRRCMEDGAWPGYPLDYNQISVPAWLFDDEMEISA